VEDDWSVLFRPTVRRILDALLAGPCSLSDLSQKTGLTKPAFLRQLRELERLGVITRTYQSTGMVRQSIYALQGCSLRLELGPPGTLSFAWATAGPADPEFPLTGQVPDPRDRREVVVALRALRQARPEDWPSLFVILFGSAARGESRPKSDVDLMIVLPRDDPALRRAVEDAIAGAQMEADHPIQPFLSWREPFLAGRKRMEQVAAEQGLVVHGDASERELWSLMKRYRTISI